MLRFRSLAAAALVAALAVLAPADAAPRRPVCKLVTDVRGDATNLYGLGTGMAPNVPALDVVSADIAVAGKVFGTVVRVDDVPDLAVDPASPSGHQWFLLFSTAKRDLFIDARSTASGTSFYLYEVEAFPGLGKPLGALSGVVDAAKNEVRIWAALSLLGSGAEIAKGARIDALEVLTARFVGVAGGGSRDVPAQPVHSDFTESGQSYVIGSQSCLAVGR